MLSLRDSQFILAVRLSINWVYIPIYAAGRTSSAKRSRVIRDVIVIAKNICHLMDGGEIFLAITVVEGITPGIKKTIARHKPYPAISRLSADPWPVCIGHFLEAATAYYETAGKWKILDTMIRYIECGSACQVGGNP
jgi:hypothetical protein